MPLSTCIVLASILGAGALCQAELLLPAKLAEIKLVLGEKKQPKAQVALLKTCYLYISPMYFSLNKTVLTLALSSVSGRDGLHVAQPGVPPASPRGSHREGRVCS